MSTSQQTNDASYVTAIKDQAVGAIKEVIGSVIGNTQMELEGKAQKVHGRNEYEYAKASQQGEAEPEKFQRAYHSEDSTELHETANKVESEPSQLSGLKDQALGAMKSTVGVATGNQEMELLGKAQNIHGRNEVEFAKAQSKGLSEPEHYTHGTKTTSQQQTKGEVEGQTVSSVEAMKDKAMGSMKETLGSMTGNQELELKGKAQNIHGRNEAEFAKAQKQGLAEPEHFAHGKKTTDPNFAEGEIVSQEPSMLSGLKDQAVGTLKSAFGAATGDQNLELIGKAQNIHGRNEAEFAKAQMHGRSEPEHFSHDRRATESSEKAEGTVEDQNISALSAAKDITVGAIKKTFGTATGNTNIEIAGLAQQMHGKNEAEFVKAQSKGLSEPEHYAHGTKTTSQQQTKGEVEGQTVSSVEAMKDKAMGSMKETLGSMTGNQELELKGKAQNIHGRNEAEFAKAQKQGLAEPEHFAHGKKTTETAKGEVVSQEPSKLSGWKDQAVGAAKETLGSATNNQKMEIEGKAQKMHGSNLCAAADEKNPTNA